MKTVIPKDYQSVLRLYDTQTAIGIIRENVEKNLATALNLKRVSAPLFVDPNTGLNDDLNGTERPVSFDILETKTDAVIVHSLAKWKRMALDRYGFSPGEGIYTDMNAVRRDEEMDNLHSIYVDQWDWEKVIREEERTKDYLKSVAAAIVNAICDAHDAVKSIYPALSKTLCREVQFVTTQELEDLYPELTPKERENRYLQIHKTVFLMEIGDVLKSGIRHDGRAPDYDDWTLNGDILFWNETLQQAFEISSMGIRVDTAAMDTQLRKAGCLDRKMLPFHEALLEGKLPLTIGGGIGQSRTCMLLLEKAHIGEVQVSLWDQNTIAVCEKAGIELL